MLIELVWTWGNMPVRFTWVVRGLKLKCPMMDFILTIGSMIGSKKISVNRVGTISQPAARFNTHKSFWFMISHNHALSMALEFGQYWGDTNTYTPKFMRQHDIPRPSENMHLHHGLSIVMWRWGSDADLSEMGFLAFIWEGFQWKEWEYETLNRITVKCSRQLWLNKDEP